MDLLQFFLVFGVLVSLSNGCALEIPQLMTIEALLGSANVSNLRYTCLVHRASSRYSEFVFAANITVSVQQPRVVLVQLVCSNNEWKVEEMAIANIAKTFPTRGECMACTKMISTCEGIQY